MNTLDSFSDDNDNEQEKQKHDEENRIENHWICGFCTVQNELNYQCCKVCSASDQTVRRRRPQQETKKDDEYDDNDTNGNDDNNNTSEYTIRMGATPYRPKINRQQQQQQHQSLSSSQSTTTAVLELPDSLLRTTAPNCQSSRDSSTRQDGGPTPDSSSIAHHPSSTADATAAAVCASRQEVVELDWLDVSRPADGDDIFLHLLGTYDDALQPQTKINFKVERSKIPSNLTSHVTTLGTIVSNPSLEDLTDDEPTAPTCHMVKSMPLEDIIQDCKRLRMSFRVGASRLPFCIKFQLERCIHHDEVISIRKRRRAPGMITAAAEYSKIRTTVIARKMIIVFCQEVLPVLLETIPQLGDSLTCAHLFADELWEPLLRVKEAIERSKPIGEPFCEQVQRAVDKAWEIVHQAEKTCRCKEVELGTNEYDDASSTITDTEAYTELIRMRSLWPSAEYRVHFTLDGRLLPKGFGVINKAVHKKQWPSLAHALKHYPAQSRRGIRQHGWDVRDRFASFSKIKFHNVHQENLAKWCRNKPIVCGRRYEFLFDKGTGSPTIWFFASTNTTSRDAYLGRIGSFAAVHTSKLGDRIGLAFTNTKPVTQLRLNQIKAIPEIIHNGYKFSDGCGVMGLNIAKRVQDIHGSNALPGSIQIRLGGTKGMLTLDENYHPDHIGIRSSMCKFASNHCFLEVKGVPQKSSQGISLFSNSVLIMHYLKVPPEIFMDLQRKSWAQIALKHDDSAPALLKEEPIDYNRVAQYVRHVVDDGIKYNKESFSLEELTSIIDEMESKKRSSYKMYLECSITLLTGVMDEWNTLEEGQVLVGNGFKTGRVLICRSPCNHPGDVQHAFAVEGSKRFQALNQIILFSSKGERPLADMLAGGDYDGDTYYVIDEPLLVNNVEPIEACNYGSQQEHIIPNFEIKQWFTVPKLESIDLEKQLDIFHKYMGLGNMVSSSGAAWLRLADRRDPGTDDALKVAMVHQKALDARKLALDDFDVDLIDQVLSNTHPNRIDKPRWNEGPASNPSNSILGSLFNKWELKINKIKAVQNLWRRQASADPWDMNADPWDMNDAATVTSETTQDTKLTQDTRQFDGQAGKPSISGKIAKEILIDATFGREKKLMTPVSPIDYTVIDDVGRKSLINMVLHEYVEKLRSEQEKAETSWIGWHPLRDYDVYLMVKEGQEMRLAICQPKFFSHRKQMEWRVSDGILPLDSTKDRRYYLESIIGVSRILESLMCNPVPILMNDAMQRSNLVAVTNVTNRKHHSPNLNSSQAAAVATIKSSSFVSGILAIQGPPGTGKTTTIVEMVLVAKKVLVLAPSNAAVANLAQKLIATNQIKPAHVVVWGENCEESIQYLNPILRHKKYDKARDDAAKKKSIEQEYGKKLKEKDNLISLCNDVGGRRGIMDAKVVLCTVNVAGSDSLRKSVRAAKSKPELCIIDEAGQMTEAEFYIATTFPTLTRLIVVGDPAQLPATVVNSTCKQAGFGNSWLGNVFALKQEKVHLLNIQYRMDPPLLRIPNQFFYMDRIVSDKSVKDRLPTVSNHFLFITTSGINCKEERDGSSWYNDYEVDVIKSLLRCDKDIQSILQANSDARVIVITPYNAMVGRLRRFLKNSKYNIDVGTVDSFQGQEGDIVIVSTVRTSSSSFVDNNNRLCVALTRGKRVLRVLGDATLFKTLDVFDSPLRKLVNLAESARLVRNAAEDDIAWELPKFTPGTTTFEASMLSSFHDCLKQMTWTQRIVAMHTLHSLVVPDIRKLKERPLECESGQWQISRLVGKEICVTWIAKRFETTGTDNDPSPLYAGVIQAHYAGAWHQCLHFVQTHRVLPAYAACGIHGDLTSIKERQLHETVPIHTSDANLEAWTVTSDLQEAIVDGTITELPEGLFALDNQQKEILCLKPPLLIESRSGTGKTNVLFQHAIAYARYLDQEANMGNKADSILFVTVSSKLQQELRDRYKAFTRISTEVLPKQITFFSLNDLLQYLIDKYSIPDRNIKLVCTYMHYVYNRTSHKKIPVESSLIANEIFGVIKGSLSAAIKERALNKEEYLLEKLSNISNDTEHGNERRHLVYQDYIKYERWKKENNKYDVADIVLQLLKLKILDQLFLSAYLDEVQDFSYATVFLICGLAGKLQGHWVAAGDTAQMISPGCSFKFVGLKNTLIKINPDIKVEPVKHLKRNYRMTKAVLDVANAVLDVAKTYFPGQIEYAEPEIAMKDLGFRVSLVNWKDAMDGRVSFGTQQAIVYAGEKDEAGLAKRLSVWTNNHPLVFSVLEAKGLEYDDVVVCFEKAPVSWNVASESVDALRNSRELYVAITRARKRVVLLSRGKPMQNYLNKSISCALEKVDAKIAMKEFEKEATPEEWAAEGRKYFGDQQYRLAESCFNRANQNAWASFAHGKFNIHISGKPDLAKEDFRSAVKAFFESAFYKNCLDVVCELSHLPPWEVGLNYIVEEALGKEPAHLSRKWAIKLAILVNAWHRLSVADMQDESVAEAFLGHRSDDGVKCMIREASETDRVAISKIVPALIGDYYMEIENFPIALQLYIAANDSDLASKATRNALSDAKKGKGDIVSVVKSWQSLDQQPSSVKKDATVKDLLLLFTDPAKVARSSGSREKMMPSFGALVVRRAVEYAQADAIILHSFDQKAFAVDVERALMERFGESSIRAVRWYKEHNDKFHSMELATTKLLRWTNPELLEVIVGELFMRPTRLEYEIERRGLLLDAVAVCLKDKSWDLAFAEKLSNKALISFDSTTANKIKLLDTWWTVSKLDDRVTAKLRQQKLSQKKISKIYLLLNLYDDPESAGINFGQHCMTKLGKIAVMDAVDLLIHEMSKNSSNASTLRYQILHRFDARAFESEKPKPEIKTKKQPETKKQPKEINHKQQLENGQRVRVDGLMSKEGKTLNGRAGSVKRVDKEGRYGVLVDGESRVISIKHTSLQPLLKEFINSTSSDSDDLPPLMKRHEHSEEEDSDKMQAKIPASRPTVKKRMIFDSESSSDDDSNDSMPPLFNRDSSSDSDSNESMPPLVERDGDSSDNSSSSSSSDSNSNTGHFKGRAATNGRTGRQRQGVSGRGQNTKGRRKGRGKK